MCHSLYMVDKETRLESLWGHKVKGLGCFYAPGRIFLHVGMVGRFRGDDSHF